MAEPEEVAPAPPSTNKEYLSDGVYVSFDGFQLWLHVSNGIEVTNQVALDRMTYSLLKSYAERFGFR